MHEHGLFLFLHCSYVGLRAVGQSLTRWLRKEKKSFALTNKVAGLEKVA
jgi:hypothetical protein